uniref:Uncharacterized protein n=1 Tax=Oryza brachyantha TaxID=4533 RepID=J3L9T3_ORYBR
MGRNRIPSYCGPHSWSDRLPARRRHGATHQHLTSSPASPRHHEHRAPKSSAGRMDTMELHWSEHPADGVAPQPSPASLDLSRIFRTESMAQAAKKASHGPRQAISSLGASSARMVSSSKVRLPS